MPRHVYFISYSHMMNVPLYDNPFHYMGLNRNAKINSPPDFWTQRISCTHSATSQTKTKEKKKAKEWQPNLTDNFL